jgi:hypothetical protein
MAVYCWRARTKNMYWQSHSKHTSMAIDNTASQQCSQRCLVGMDCRKQIICAIHQGHGSPQASCIATTCLLLLHTLGCKIHQQQHKLAWHSRHGAQLATKHLGFKGHCLLAPMSPSVAWWQRWRASVRAHPCKSQADLA